MISRAITNGIQDSLRGPRKVIVIYGARQVGKTTLANAVLDGLGQRVLRLSADDRNVVSAFSSRDTGRLGLMARGNDLLFLDEAQRIPDIGLSLKILHDQFPELRVIITGSSSLEMAATTREALTGRTRIFNLHPISLGELAATTSPFELDGRIDELLRFGSYPEVFAYPGDQAKAGYLRELCSAYLYKDILELAHPRHGNKLADLLRLLAFQIGSQVSLSELGNNLGLSKETVARYIDLLEQSFVVFRLSGFSRNLRKEMGKMSKIYFWDLGVRNSIINNHNAMELRNDAGHLWENFLMIERMKRNQYAGDLINSWFWRTHTGAELDLVEEQAGRLDGWEFKWGERNAKVPKTWLDTYPGAGFGVVNRNNYLDWLSV
jgi:predicted AAA+ superfamily ATPase